MDVGLGWPNPRFEPSAGNSSQSKRWVFRRPQPGESVERPARWQGSDLATRPVWAPIRLNRGISHAAFSVAGARGLARSM